MLLTRHSVCIKVAECRRKRNITMLLPVNKLDHILKKRKR